MGGFFYAQTPGEQVSKPQTSWECKVLGWDMVAPDQLTANPGNYRRHPAAQRRALRGSLNELGIIAPVIWNVTTGRLLDGHARVDEYLEAGVVEVPRILVEVPADKESLALLSLDPIAAMAEADKDALDSLLREVNTSDDGLQDMLAGLAKDAGLYLDAVAEEPDVLAPVDRAEELRLKWGTELGQIWTMGPHRLMCGDSTSEADTAALFAGHRANLVVTDPPYGVSYESESAGSIANDDKRDDALVGLLKGALVQAVKNTTQEAAFYIWHPSSTRRDFEWAMEAAGLQERQYITWVKSTFALGRSDYQWQAELCFYAEKAGQRAAFHGDRAQSTAWFIDVPPAEGGVAVSIANGLRLLDGDGGEIVLVPRAAKGKKLRVLRVRPGEPVVVAKDNTSTDLWQVHHDKTNFLHPTQKPTELAARSIRNSSRPGERVYDPFAGGDFVPLAAEREGRVALCMELDPKFVAVILERMSGVGQMPELTALA